MKHLFRLIFFSLVEVFLFINIVSPAGGYQNENVIIIISMCLFILNSIFLYKAIRKTLEG